MKKKVKTPMTGKILFHLIAFTLDGIEEYKKAVDYFDSQMETEITFPNFEIKTEISHGGCNILYGDVYIVGEYDDMATKESKQLLGHFLKKGNTPENRENMRLLMEKYKRNADVYVQTNIDKFSFTGYKITLYGDGGKEKTYYSQSRSWEEYENPASGICRFVNRNGIHKMVVTHLTDGEETVVRFDSDTIPIVKTME